MSQIKQQEYLMVSQSIQFIWCLEGSQLRKHWCNLQLEAEYKHARVIETNPHEHFTKGITASTSYSSVHFAEQLTNLTQSTNERT